MDDTELAYISDDIKTCEMTVKTQNSHNDFGRNCTHIEQTGKEDVRKYVLSEITSIFSRTTPIGRLLRRSDVQDVRNECE